jgi:TRAP-type C4-dicarboxylate transport system permease small subunit
LQRLSDLYGRFLTGLALLAAWLVLAMVGLITLNVVMRNLEVGVIGWTDEVSEYALYAITLLAAPWLLRLGAHVRVDIVLTSLKPAAGWALEIVADSLGLLVSFALAGYGVAAALQSQATLSVTVKSLVFPEWWVLAPLPLAFLLLAVEFVFRLHQLVNGKRQPRPASSAGLA